MENDTHLAPRLASHLGLYGISYQRFSDIATADGRPAPVIETFE